MSGSSHQTVKNLMSPDLLSAVPMLTALEEVDRSRLAARLRERKVEAGQAIFSRGDPGEEMFLVADGPVEIFLPEEAGSQRVVLRTLGPGDHFGELALLEGARRTASAVAQGPVLLLELRREDFMEIVLASPAGARAVVSALAERLIATNNLLSERASRDVIGELLAARTPSERLAENVAAWNGSWGFLVFLLALCAGWAWINSVLGRPFDPFPYNFFNLVLAVLVVLQGPILMMAQNREAAAERAAMQADFRINLKNEIAIERIGREVAELRRELGARTEPPAG